jgi:predicted transcriptional regulator
MRKEVRSQREESSATFDNEMTDTTTIVVLDDRMVGTMIAIMTCNTLVLLRHL